MKSRKRGPAPPVVRGPLVLGRADLPWASPDPLERAPLPARSAASPARGRSRVSTLRPAHPCTSSVSASPRTHRARPSPGASRDIPRQRPPPRAAVGIGSRVALARCTAVPRELLGIWA